MRSYDLVVCGGGAAGHAAVRAYREAGGDGSVLLATREDRLPYARPPLSKEYLRGEMTAAELALDDVAWYAAKEIVTALGSPVRGLDAAHRRLLLAGETIDFTTVILATGASPAALPVRGGDDPAILRLRDPDDSDRIRSAGARGSVAVIGSGFIGCEVAASLALTGTPCSWSARRPRRRRRCSAPTPAAHRPVAHRRGRRAGASAAPCSASRTAARGPRERPRDRRRHDRHRRRHRAEHRARAHAGMELDNDRIPCDASMQTVAPGVLWPATRPTPGTRPPAAAWSCSTGARPSAWARSPGHVAADQHDAWTQAPGFWSTIGDHTLKHVAWGDGHDDTRLLEGGDDDTFAVLYGQRGTLVGVLASNLDDVYEQGGGLVEAGASLHEAAATLADAAASAIPLPEPNSRQPKRISRNCRFGGVLVRRRGEGAVRCRSPRPRRLPMTQYLLSVHMVEGAADAAPRTSCQQMYADVDAFNDEIQEAGRLGVRRRPAPADTATVVRVAERRGARPPTARSPRPRSSSAASGSSRPPTSTPRWRGPPRPPSPARARSRCARSRTSRGLSAP